MVRSAPWRVPGLLTSFCLFATAEPINGTLVTEEGGRKQTPKWTAAEVLGSMGRGINLGNVYDYDTGNDATFCGATKMIRSFKEKGFKNVRIPVTWGGSFDPHDEVTKTILEVVHYALRRGLYVILNTHHERWLKDDYNNTAYFNDKFAALWTGIAKHFVNASERLIFEILNEPDGALGGWMPGHADPFHARSLALTRAVNEVGYSAVRAVSKERVVLLMPNGMGSQSLAKHVYPNPSFLPGEGSDQFLGVSVHTYDPWEFCGESGSIIHFSNIAAMEEHMRRLYGELANWQFQTRVPLHIGEYGVGRTDDNSEQRDTDMARAYYKYVTNTFALQGWPSTVWDDRGWFAIVSNYTYVHGLADAILSNY